MSSPDRQIIHFDEKIKLYEEPMGEINSIQGPAHLWKLRKFFLSDLDCEGMMTIHSYFDYPFEWNMPARMINQELSPIELFNIWVDNFDAQDIKWLSMQLTLDIPEKKWLDFIKDSMSRRLPLVCCLENKEMKFRQYAALTKSYRYQNVSREKTFLHMVAATWFLPEDSPEKMDKRWEEFRGVLSDGKGEVLLIPNLDGGDFGQNQVIKNMEFSFYPFGG